LPIRSKGACIDIARVSFQLPEDFLNKISALGSKTDDIVPRVLAAGGEVVLAKVKSNLQAVIGKGKHKSRSTGELVEALGVSQARQDRNGDWNAKIGFDEPRRDGKSNAMLANISENGKHNQPPRPFLKPAKSAAKSACIAAMKAKLSEELEKA
jgi:HK97 gp10 family phage protein